MDRDRFLDAFLSTLDDERVTRTERKALGALLDDDPPSDHDREVLRARMFDALAERLDTERDRALLHALRVALGRLDAPQQADDGVDRRPTRVWFGPEEPMSETLCTLIAAARETIDVAVFTITDNRVTAALLAAHDRGVGLRVLTDDDKSFDRGSDIQRLREHGVPVGMDRSEAHFHHKFAIFDGRSVLTGSYNWTRGAANVNRENFMLTWDPEALQGYTRGFEALWEEFGPRF